MKPPLVLSFLAVIVISTNALADGVALATEAGTKVSGSLGPAELAGLIALGFLPVLYMLHRARLR